MGHLSNDMCSYLKISGLKCTCNFLQFSRVIKSMGKFFTASPGNTSHGQSINRIQQERKISLTSIKTMMRPHRNQRQGSAISSIDWNLGRSVNSSFLHIALPQTVHPLIPRISVIIHGSGEQNIICITLFLSICSSHCLLYETRKKLRSTQKKMISQGDTERTLEKLSFGSLAPEML